MDDFNNYEKDKEFNKLIKEVSDYIKDSKQSAKSIAIRSRDIAVDAIFKAKRRGSSHE